MSLPPVARSWPWSWMSRVPASARDAIVVGITGLFGALSLQVHWPDQSAFAMLAVLVLATQVLPLFWMRPRPILVLGVVTAAFFLREALGFRFQGATIGVVAAMYFVGAYAGRRRWMVFSLWVVWTAAFAAGSAMSGHSLLSDSATTWAIVCAAFLIGDNVRTRRAYLAELGARLDRDRRQIEQERALAAAEERARIARELHDVVAHHVSAIAVQADAIRAVRPEDPAADAMAMLATNARRALVELSRLLGVLRRDGDEAAPRTPEAGIDQLRRLVAETRTAGLDVDLVVSGDAQPVADAVDLSAYRIVQEALTNTLKYARGARVEVSLCYGQRVLDIRVADDGAGRPAALPLPSSGRGLVGMRERVTVFGGTFAAGPQAKGGFEVVARLPLEPAS